MLKDIHINQLRPGMFVNDFNALNRTNFATNQILIKSRKAIEAIRAQGITHLSIDLTKGVDVQQVKPQEQQKSTSENLHVLAKKYPHAAPRVSLQEEMQIADRIKRTAIKTIQQALASAEEGKAVDIDSAFNLIEEMQQSVTRNPDALSLLTRIRQKDEYTLMHSISVGSHVLAFCNFCKIPQQTTMNLAVGALFHDIGKTQIPLSILNKPGKLTDEEFGTMRKHSEYSAEALATARGLPTEAYDIALHHHERFDGSGYPHGLKGSEISLGSQIVAICDVFDAITSLRCYKNALNSVEGLKKIYEWSEFHFNKKLAFKFIRCIGVYPIGSCVKLDNKLIGVVIGSTQNILQPITRVFYDDKQKTFIPREDIDLSRIGINVMGYEPTNKWNIDKMQLFEDITATTNPFY